MPKCICLDSSLSSFMEREILEYMVFGKADVEIALKRLALK